MLKSMQPDEKIDVNFNFMHRREETPVSPPLKNDEGRSSKKLARIIDFVIGLSIVAIFFGVPLFFTGLTFQGISFEKQSYFYFWILLALIAWGAKGSYLGELKIRKTPLDIPILAFWVFYGIVTIVSVDRWHSFIGFFGDPSRGFLSATGLVIAYYLIVSNFTPVLLKWIIRAFLTAGFIIVAWSVLLTLNAVSFIPASFLGFLPISFVGSVSGLAIFTSVLVPFIMMMVFQIQNNEKLTKTKKILFNSFFLFFLALDLFLILLIYSYMPWLGLLIGVVLFLLFVLSKIVRPRDPGTIIPMIVFVVVITFLMLGRVNLARLNLPVNVSVPYNTSFDIAKSSLKDKFFLGYGAANYGYAFSKNLPVGFDNMNVRFLGGEGIILEALPSIGAIGTVLLVILLLTFLGTNLFLLSREKEKNKIYSLGILSATIILIVDLMYIRAEAAIIILAAIFGALSVAVLAYESDIKENSISFSLKASPKFALTLSFITLLIFASVAFLFVFIGKMFMADIYMGSASKQNNVSVDGSISKIVRAIQLNSKEGRYYTTLGQEYMVLTNNEMLKGTDQQDKNKIAIYLKNAIDASKMGEQLMPNDVTTVEAVAQIFENARFYLDGWQEGANQKYSRALDLEPSNPSFNTKLGEIKLAVLNGTQKDDERKSIISQASDLFQKAITIRANYAPAHYDLALDKEALSDLDGSIDEMNKAVLLDRNNVNYVFNLARLYQERGKGDDNKISEDLFKKILGVNNKEINTHFNLGLLYEKTNRKSDAVSEYNAVLNLLPAGSDKTKTQIQKMISNIQNGIENTPENLGLTSPDQNQAPASGQ